MPTTVIDELDEIAYEMGPKCSVRAGLDALNDTKIAEQLNAAIKSGKYSIAIIKTFFVRRGITVGEASISKHKSGVCQCQIRLSKS